jgi:threonine dehydrogenase-like Zn-dependent dehydrogenase
MMKALVWTAPERMEMHEQPIPTLKPGEALIRVAYAGICGSELSGYLGHNALRVPPLVMGHEFSGVVEATAPDVPAQFPALKPGVWVTVNPIYATAPSALTERGLEQLAANRRVIGAHQPGAFADYVAVPARMATMLPPGLGLREGALAEPVGCAVRIGELAGNIAGEPCLVIGAGPIGLLAMQVLLLKGASQIFIADLDRERLAMGAALGGVALHPHDVDLPQAIKEQTGGTGVAASVDAVGTGQTRAQCVAATRTTGVVILTGLHEEISTFPAADVIRREITLKGAFAYSRQNFADAVALLADSKVTLDPWIVEAPLAEGGQWFDRLIKAPGNVSKVLLVPPQAKGSNA